MVLRHLALAPRVNQTQVLASTDGRSHGLHGSISNGQLQWYVRMTGFDHAFDVSMLAGNLSKPCVKHLKFANEIVKSIKQT